MCIISFPPHPHRGAGSQTSAKHRPLFDLGNSPSHVPPLLMKCPSMECLHYYAADRDWCSPQNHLHMQHPAKKRKKGGKKTGLNCKGGKNLNVGKWTFNCGCFCLKYTLRGERGQSFAMLLGEIYWNVARGHGVGLCLSESSFEARCDATSELLRSQWHIASQMIKPPSTNLEILCRPYILFSNPCDKTFNSGLLTFVFL